jgi:hypothetical protein
VTFADAGMSSAYPGQAEDIRRLLP